MPAPATLTHRHLTLVSGYLDAFFARKISAAADMHPRYETLWREITRVASHGKRLRPCMTLLAYEALSDGKGDISHAIPAACAGELLHVSMLIHDDIIDRDLLRHGQPTVQAAYEQRYAQNIEDAGERRHNAVGAALLAGDLLLSEARGMITKSGDGELPDDRVRQAGYAFDQAVFEVAGGELLDVESTFTARGTIDPLTIVTYKTAGYSFISPLLIGAILAGAGSDVLKQVRTFALNLGIAYQLTDDLLGIFGDTGQTGKPNDGDIREGKGTYLVERFYNLADSTTAARFNTMYGNRSVTATECDAIRYMLETSGAVGETRTSISFHTARAHRALQALNLSDEYTKEFEKLIIASTDRSR